MKKMIVPLAGVLVVLGGAVSSGSIIVPDGINAWPNERTSGFLPANAIDDDLATLTWSTEAGTTATAFLGLDFGAAEPVNRIRLWKDDASGSFNVAQDPKDLVILYTTDSGSLSSRAYTPVTNLTNGFEGTELMNALSVNSNGTVDSDSHDSINEGDGWASLTFDTINATGIAIQFTRQLASNNHYKVHEFEAHMESAAVPEPNTVLLIGLGIVAAAVWRVRGVNF